LRFDSSQKTRKSDIAGGSYELFLVKGAASLVLVGPFLSSDTSSLFQLFLSPEFQNPNFAVPFHSLLSCASIQAKKLGNPISHEGAMSFFWCSLVLVGPFLSSGISALFQPFLSP
jgi:hypothetical protein